VDLIRRKFGLTGNENDLSLSVSSLDCCCGEDVEIDEDVYEILAPYLDHVKVVLPGAKEPTKGAYPVILFLYSESLIARC
jgi:hypothetical protein